jgi:hypothetical protein
MLAEHPYEFSSDDILYAVFATRKEIPTEDLEEQHHLFFSKGQPCFRASPLTKRYGWGVHSNKEGKIAIVGVESEEYQKFLADESIIKIKAMRSKRA